MILMLDRIEKTLSEIRHCAEELVTRDDEWRDDNNK